MFEAAKDARIFAIGVDADQHDEMPGTVLTSMVKRGDVAVYDTVEEKVEELRAAVIEGRIVVPSR